jgi:hypothetical protein
MFSLGELLFDPICFDALFRESFLVFSGKFHDPVLEMIYIFAIINSKFHK